MGIYYNGKRVGNIIVTGSNAPISQGDGDYSLVQNSQVPDGDRDCLATEHRSAAFGYRTQATNIAAFASGEGAIASGRNSQASNEMTESQGRGSHAEGKVSKAKGMYSHAEGSETVSGFTDNTVGQIWGDQATHSEGYKTKAIDRYSHAEGYGTLAGHEGHPTIDLPNNPATVNFDAAGASHAEGYQTKATAEAAHSEGKLTEATGSQSHAEGYQTVASGLASHSEGILTESSNDGSHAEGFAKIGSKIIASGQGSHAEGLANNNKNVESTNLGSHAEGVRTKASGAGSHAEGADTEASGGRSHAEGDGTKATSTASHAEGVRTVSSGVGSHADGVDTIANSRAQHVFGEFNIADVERGSNRGTYVEIVGKGRSASARSNARTLDWDGNEVLAGKLTVGTQPTNPNDVATKAYVDSHSGGGGDRKYAFANKTYTVNGDISIEICVTRNGGNIIMRISPFSPSNAVIDYTIMPVNYDVTGDDVANVLFDYCNDYGYSGMECIGYLSFVTETLNNVNYWVTELITLQYVFTNENDMWMSFKMDEVCGNIHDVARYPTIKNSPNFIPCFNP